MPPEPPLKFKCPSCDQSLSATEDLFGMTLKCPSCSVPVVVPSPVVAAVVSTIPLQANKVIETVQEVAPSESLQEAVSDERGKLMVIIPFFALPLIFVTAGWGATPIIIGLAVLLISAVLIYIDARTLGIGGKSMSFGWAILTCLLWIVAYPYYMSIREHYVKSKRRIPAFLATACFATITVMQGITAALPAADSPEVTSMLQRMHTGGFVLSERIVAVTDCEQIKFDLLKMRRVCKASISIGCVLTSEIYYTVDWMSVFDGQYRVERMPLVSGSSAAVAPLQAPVAAPQASVVDTLATSANAYKESADRAACVLGMRNVQQAVRTYQNTQQMEEGDALDWTIILGNEGYMKEPVCPAGGTYTFSTTIPRVGESCVICSHAADMNHVPGDALKSVEDQYAANKYASLKQKEEVEQRLREYNVKKEQMEQKEREDKAQEQKDRAALAAKLLGEVKLNPNIILSAGLQKMESSIEMRGEEYEKLTKMQKNGDWLGLLASLDHGGKEYPNDESIKSAVEALKNVRSNKILLKTKFKCQDGDSLNLVTFSDKAQIITHSPWWTKHPDSIGYLADWCPNDGDGIIIGGDQDTRSNISNIERSYFNELSSLRSKKSLGELTDDAFNLSVEALKKKAFQDISKLASER